MHPLIERGAIGITPEQLRESFVQTCEVLEPLSIRTTLGHSREFVPNGAIVGRSLTVVSEPHQFSPGFWAFVGILEPAGSIAPHVELVHGLLRPNRLELTVIKNLSSVLSRS